MTKDFRFGRRMQLPSTFQIRHELEVFCELEDARKKHALHDGLPETASWDDIGLFRARAEREFKVGAPELPNTTVLSAASFKSEAEL